MRDLEEYERKEEIEFMRAVSIGLMEVREGKELELDEVKNKLGLAYTINNQHSRS